MFSVGATSLADPFIDRNIYTYIYNIVIYAIIICPREFMIVARLFQRFEGGFVVHLKTKHEAYFFVSLLFFSLSLVCTLESVLV